MLLFKAVGFILLLMGLLLLRYFPGPRQYQKAPMSITGVWLGIIIVVLGIVLLTFG